MNPDRAALIAGPAPSAPSEGGKKPNIYQKWKPTAGGKKVKPLTRAEKKKKKRPWTKEKPTSKRAQRAGPRSLAKQGLRVRVPKTPQQKAKQLERKQFRMKQKAGAVYRKRITYARREGYRVVKRTARPMKEYMARYRLALIAVEQEAHKKIHVEVDEFERRNAMAFCNMLGFTIENTEGTKDIKPRVLGMKGKELDLDNLEKELQAAEEKVKQEKADAAKYGVKTGNRIDLGKVRDEEKTTFIGGGDGGADPNDFNDEFISFDNDDDDDAPVADTDINYNHKMRRKLNRAILAAQLKKENLVRARAFAHCEANGIEMPRGFTPAHQPCKLDNHRMLIDGTIETAKQERVRKRVETAKFNELARAFRKIAKAGQQAAAEKMQQEILEEVRAERLAKGLPIDDLGKNPPWAEHHSEKSKRVKREKNRQEAMAAKKGSKANSDDSSSDGDSSDSYDSEDSDAPQSKKPNETSKKRARSDSDESDSGEKKKRKLSKDTSKPVSTESNGSSEQPGDASKSSDSKAEKKKSKKTVKIAEPADVIMEDAPAAPQEEADKKAAKKEKKPKKEKKEKKAETEDKAEEKQEATSIANDWNADALDGDAARKEKYLRLLGGKKEGASSKSTSKSKDKASMDISKVQSDLEKQFQQGIELKHGGLGKRRGIGG